MAPHILKFRQYMEMSGQLRTPPVLSPRKQLLIPLDRSLYDHQWSKSNRDRESILQTKMGMEKPEISDCH